MKNEERGVRNEVVSLKYNRINNLIIIIVDQEENVGTEQGTVEDII